MNQKRRTEEDNKNGDHSASDSSPDLAREIASQALSILDTAKRAAFLDSTVGNNAKLRGQVTSIIAKTEGTLGVSAFPSKPDDMTAPHVSTHPPGNAPTEDTIGPYTLLQPLGQGGMGTVYHARQDRPVKRDVAVKVIKAGMDSRQVIARFEAERQALALMNHQNIARVFEAGTTDNGRPYFVMELVEGMPITEFCDERQLSPIDRLRLMIPVCQAIQHAHQKGVIHRDIKPSNCLVSKNGTETVAVPKVIDFGLAKALQQPLTEGSMDTQLGQVVGTLSYMSPEQAELTSTDIDTRTDVYSLGVMLYELLTGNTPLDRERTKTEAFDRLLKAIREENPPKPSTRLSQPDETVARLAAQRATVPKQLTRLLRGDLDAIVMKSLEKDRARRYESAAAMAADIQRYLTHEPVEAQPPSAVYRLRMLATKYRAAFITSAAFAALLITALATVSWLALRATRAEATANAATTQAKNDAAIANEISNFLQNDLLMQASPYESSDPDLALRTVLDRAAERIEGRFTTQPLVEASLQSTIASAYSSLSQYKKAKFHSERSIELRTREQGAEHPKTLRRVHELGTLQRELGQYQEALDTLSQTLKIQIRQLGNVHQDTIKTARELASTYHVMGNYDRAEEMYKEYLQHQIELTGDENDDTLEIWARLADLYGMQGRFMEAEPIFERIYNSALHASGPEHPNTLNAMNNLASNYRWQGRVEEAETLFVEILRIRRQVLDPDHGSTLISLGNLAELYVRMNQHEKAQQLLHEALDMSRRTLGERHPSTLNMTNHLGISFQQNGQLTEAVPLLESALDLARDLHGNDHPNTLRACNNLAELYRCLGRLDDAEPLYDETLSGVRKHLGPRHPHTLMTIHNLAWLYETQQRYQAAIDLRSELLNVLLERRDAKQPEDDFSFASSLVRQAACHNRLGRYQEAETLAGESAELFTKIAPSTYRHYEALSVLGEAIAGQQRYEEAEPHVLQAWAGILRTENDVPPPIRAQTKRQMIERIIELYTGWEKPKQLAEWKDKLDEMP